LNSRSFLGCRLDQQQVLKAFPASTYMRTSFCELTFWYASITFNPHATVEMIFGLYLFAGIVLFISLKGGS
jgi:hypothetical protein